MNLDTYLDAAEGCGNMKDFKRNLGMEGDKSYDVLVAVLCGCVSDHMEAVRHPAEFYADFAATHRGAAGERAALLSRALSDMKEALRDG